MFFRRLSSFLLPVLLVPLFVVLLSSCGRRGSPKPPEATAPSPVKYLTAAGTVNSVVLTWQAPDTQADGDELLNLERFIVKRSKYEKDEAPDFEEIGEMPFQAAESGPAQPEPKQAREYIFTDQDVQPGKQYEYEVLPENDDGVEGRPSAVIRVTFTGESSYFESFAPESEAANPFELQQ